MGSVHRPGFCFSGLRVPREAVTFQASPPFPSSLAFLLLTNTWSFGGNAEV